VKKLFYFLALTIVTVATACSDRSDTPTEPTQSEWVFEEANSFLEFINTQASLGAGTYKLVVGTESSGVSGDYSITINVNGTSSILQGSWSSSGGKDANSSSNPSHDVVLESAGGLTTSVSSSQTAYLYLTKNDVVIAEGSEIDLPISQIDSQAYTDAYYRAVDPNNERTTLAGWQQVNGFNAGYDAHVVFRDTKDLGYGRNMFVRRDADTGVISFFVRNYAANLGGEDGQYGSANVVAAIEEMHKYHIGTNAIEFSPIDQNDANSEKILKFFTFRRDRVIEGATEYRKDTIDLDGRGEKQMPVPCLVCHGARLLPLDENGEFQLISLRSAKLNQLEVESFEFADVGEFQKEEIEGRIRLINQYINEVYESIGIREASNPNRWESSFALELSEGIQPHCISCHSIRGKSVAEVNRAVNDINFSTYEKFMSYNDKIIDYVYKRGIMPLSLLNYSAFWDEPNGAPALLASFLPGFDLYNENNLPLEPGKPFAKPGENRTAWSPVQLNGSASLFANVYTWSIVSQPSASIVSLDNTEIANPILTADTNGNYVLELTVSNALGSHAERTTITIDDSISSPLQKHQSQLTFADDIMNDIMGADDESKCANCHRSQEMHFAANGGYDQRYDGIPVFYTYYTDSLMSEVNLNLYRHVRARVNLADPENSLLLRKPTGNHHGGGVRVDRDTLAGETEYQILLNWIREGAICGDPDTYAICR
jgi:PKD repeat protein